MNYVCKAYDHRQKTPHGSHLLMDTILSKGYLWDNVRVLNGAYGCFLVSTLNMQQYVVSYRDPSLTKTIEIYNKLPEYVKNLKLTKEELFKHKIGALG